jgi:lipoprotein signal peptidase
MYKLREEKGRLTVKFPLEYFLLSVIALFEISLKFRYFPSKINSFYNEGLAFGFGSKLLLPEFILFTETICLLIIVFLIFGTDYNKRGLAYLLTGGILNFFDRLINRRIVDYLYGFGIYFNLADVLILMGILFLIYDQMNNKK